MYAEYGAKVAWFCTINEPEVFVSNAYVTGLFPPGHQGRMQLAGTVMKVSSCVLLCGDCVCVCDDVRASECALC
jgi:beta-glucosidase/6-phospho-beta-glucosidase/beta-galactosidase